MMDPWLVREFAEIRAADVDRRYGRLLELLAIMESSRRQGFTYRKAKTAILHLARSPEGKIPDIPVDL